MRHVLTICVMLAFPAVTLAGEKGLTAKGKIQIGNHVVKMETGNLYHITIEGKGFQPQAQIQPGFLPFFDGGPAAKRNLLQTFFMPSETREHRLLVLPGAFGINTSEDGALEYLLSIKPIVLEKPLVKADDKWTAQDPIYQAKTAFGVLDKKTNFKAFPVKMKAGNVYVIDLVRKADQRVDPFLYLEGPDGKIVAEDDDGGGMLNARLIFPARQDGDYRVIATTLVPATGDFTLTIRAGAMEK
jgi:hypothetical protein